MTFFRAKAGQKAGFRVMLKYLETKKAFRYYIKQIDSMLPCVCSVIDHRRRQNVVRTSVTHSAIASCATFLFLPHFDVVYCESVNLIGYITVDYLLIVNSYASVHIARHV